MVKQIHEKHFSREFDLPEFQKFIAAFTIHDLNDRIVTVGGIRTILECVVVADRDLSMFVRRAAYFNMLDACMYMAGKSGYDQIHAFVQGDRWIEALKNIGFRDTRGKSLVMDI